MPIRSRRQSPVRPPVKPAPNAGLTLFVDDAPDCLWVRIVLAEKDVETARIQRVRADRPDEDFLVLNPGGTLPALADREGVFVGARVIAEYLDERYPHPPLMPLGPAPRARVRQQIERLESRLLPALAGNAGMLDDMTRETLVEAFRDRRGRDATESEFTLADCGWAAVFVVVAAAGVALPAEVRGLRAWAASLMARAAVRKVLQS